MTVEFPAGFPERGEIYLADLDKRRPVIVISEDRGNRSSSQLVVATITTSIQPKHFPVNVLLPAQDPLSRESEVRCRTLTTIKQSDLVEYRGRLSAVQMTEVGEALRAALGL